MTRVLALSFICLGFLVGCGSNATTITAPEKFSAPGELEVLGGPGGDGGTSAGTAPKIKPQTGK
jgi:hypothetical protein